MGCMGGGQSSQPAFTQYTPLMLRLLGTFQPWRLLLATLPPALLLAQEHLSSVCPPPAAAHAASAARSLPLRSIYPFPGVTHSSWQGHF